MHLPSTSITNYIAATLGLEPSETLKVKRSFAISKDHALFKGLKLESGEDVHVVAEVDSE